MTIADIRENHITPFECEDEKLVKLFSFFLHKAPTIESATAIKIEDTRLQDNWKNFIANFDSKQYKIIKSNCKIENYIAEYNLQDTSEVTRKSKHFICKLKYPKSGNETDYECLLRHLRNSIAHSNVFFKNTGNRKYLLFEDYNKSGNLSALILLSQSDLARLKKEITK